MNKPRENVDNDDAEGKNGANVLPPSSAKIFAVIFGTIQLLWLVWLAWVAWKVHS